VVSSETAGGGSGGVWTPHTFSGAIGGLLVCAFLNALTAAARVWCTAMVEVRLIARVQERLFASIMKQETSFFDAVSSGELASRLTSDTSVLAVSLTTNFNLILQNSVNLLTSVAVMLSVDWQLTLGFQCASLIFFYLSKRVGALTRSMQKDIQDATSVANGGATQAIGLLRTVRSLGAEELETAKYGAQVAALKRQQEKIKAVWAFYVPMVAILNNVLLVVVLAVGHATVHTPQQAAGFAVFVFYTNRIQNAMTGISQVRVARSPPEIHTAAHSPFFPGVCVLTLELHQLPGRNRGWRRSVRAHGQAAQDAYHRRGCAHHPVGGGADF
jgi:ABC-type multidrug transport system fused ATPase/permease subunit